MVVGVDADLVALRVHPLHQVLHAVGHPPSHQEKGGLHPPLRQAVQQRGGGGAPGSVVKGKRQQSPLGGGGRGARPPSPPGELRPPEAPAPAL